jgi:hypothetical protein
MLKQSLVSPAQPRQLLHPPAPSLPRQPLCPGTRLFPCSVLPSFRPSNGDPAASPLGGAHRLGAPYSSYRAPQKGCLDSSLAAALPGTRRVLARRGWAGEKSGLFEHPAGLYSCGATRGDHRSADVSKWFFRSLRGLELLLSLIRQRSIQRIHPVADVLQSGISLLPYGQIVRPMVAYSGTSQRGTDWNQQWTNLSL